MHFVSIDGSSAIHSGVSGERGGFVLLQINPSIAKAQYPGSFRPFSRLRI